MWILTEDKTRIFDTSSSDTFYLLNEGNTSACAVMYHHPDGSHIRLGVYKTKLMATTAIEHIFKSLEAGRNAHAMY